MKFRVFSEVEVEASDKEFAGGLVKQALRSTFPGSKPKVWSEEDRDPKYTPRPGDKLVKGDIERDVMEISGTTVTYWTFRTSKANPSGEMTYVPKGQAQTCRLTTWLNWTREAKVIS